MASAIYPKALQSFLTQSPSIAITTDTIKVAAVSNSDYTYSATDQYKSAVTSYAGTTDAVISGITGTSGTMAASNLAPAFSALAQSGAKKVDALVIYKDTGVASTSPLICYMALGTSLTPNGGDVDITWNASGILAI
jgi:hypothetical protein